MTFGFNRRSTADNLSRISKQERPQFTSASPVVAKGESWIIAAPSGGIPKFDGTTAGMADCQVKYLDASGELKDSPIGTRPVWNITPDKIKGGAVKLALMISNKLVVVPTLTAAELCEVICTTCPPLANESGGCFSCSQCGCCYEDDAITLLDFTIAANRYKQDGPSTLDPEPPDDSGCWFLVPVKDAAEQPYDGPARVAVGCDTSFWSITAIAPDTGFSTGVQEAYTPDCNRNFNNPGVLFAVVAGSPCEPSGCVLNAPCQYQAGAITGFSFDETAGGGQWSYQQSGPSTSSGDCEWTIPCTSVTEPDGDCIVRQLSYDATFNVWHFEAKGPAPNDTFLTYQTNFINGCVQVIAAFDTSGGGTIRASFTLTGEFPT